MEPTFFPFYLSLIILGLVTTISGQRHIVYYRYHCQNKNIEACKDNKTLSLLLNRFCNKSFKHKKTLIQQCKDTLFGNLNVASGSIIFIIGQSNGELRLSRDGVVSRTYTSGRVQIYFNGQWGNICDNEFDMVAADVSCHQLGYDRALGFSTGANDRCEFFQVLISY